MAAARYERQSIVDSLLADPPVVHIIDTPEGKAPGVWSTDESCYRFIAQITQPGMQTLETGSGLSTALFAALGARHRCVTPAAIEADHLRRYFTKMGISEANVIFDIAPSHEALPRLSDDLDVVFIDGAHGFPAPIVDWFYAGSLLGLGGIFIVDDIALPAVDALLDFVRQDRRWEEFEHGSKWVAFRRLSSGTLLEGQWDQEFYLPQSLRPPLPRRLLGRVRRELQRRSGPARESSHRDY